MDSFQTQQDRNGFTVPQITNPPPHQYFGDNDQETSPMMENFPIGQFFGDENDSGNIDDSNDAKRRRIARVRIFPHLHGRGSNWTCARLAICAGRKRSNAMEKCQHAPIASTTRPSAYSRR